MSKPLSNEPRQQPSIPVNHHSRLERIADATHGIYQCKRRLLDLSYDRATAVAACANFELALRDAAEMQKIVPSSPMGYLCQGDIHRLQGRQSAAIAAYNKGLALPPKWPDDRPIYQQLQNNKKDAEYERSKRIDFITQLPLDIVMSYIIPKIMGDHALDAQEPCEYLYVSRAWREQIIHDQDGLQFFVNDLDDTSDQLVRFAPYIGTLAVREYQSNLNHCNVLHDYPLTRLGIKDFHGECLDPFFQALQSHSSHMTHLKIGDIHGATVRIADVLSSCPYLESFEIETARFDLTHLPQQSFPSLKKLRIGANNDYIPDDNMMSLLKLLPSLEYLGVSPWQTTKPLIAISQHCRSLKFLQYGSRYMGQDWHRLSMNLHHGLQCIQMQGLRDTTYDPRDMDHLLACHHNTLQVLDIRLSSQSTDLKLSFPRLRRLVIKSRSMDDPCFYGWWIPRYAPNIQEFEFDTNVVDKCPGLLLGLQRHFTLRSLKVHVNDRYLPQSCRLLLRDFLKHQTQLQSFEAHVQSYMLVDGSWLTSIYSMSRLQLLDLHIADDIYPVSSDFMESLSRHCSLLEKIHIRCGRGITDDILLHIQWKYLNELTIPIADLSRTTIMSLMTRAHLKILNIIPSAHDDEKALTMLKRARPDIHISRSYDYRY
ncbi:hypothetical protein K492DRAFT_200424 [Lichtheimia hyalospora FSU 10163]|nr:hypothetical protein K492DRAFT_200424 [Lichtheimia hyalospora FSU 10163]